MSGLTLNQRLLQYYSTTPTCYYNLFGEFNFYHFKIQVYTYKFFMYVEFTTVSYLLHVFL